jgi:cation transport protein ChaC
MWVFGYGSLMSDGWQKQFACNDVVRAELHGYARTFNKKSSERWGTRAAPGPTLNLVATPKLSCTGVAFSFPDDQADGVLSYLRRREGKNFELRELEVTAAWGVFAATVPVYTGQNVFDTTDATKLALLALHASGTAGRCRDYVDRIYRDLQLLEIDDPSVTAVWKALQVLIAAEGGPSRQAGQASS